MKFFQPFKDGELPGELMSFMVFPTSEACSHWINENLPDPETWEVKEYDNTDIEDAVLVDRDGTFLYQTVDGACSLSAYNTGKELDAAQEDLLKTVRDALSKTGKTRIELMAPMLFENEKDLGGSGDGLVFVTAIDAENIQSYERSFPLRNVTDFDDIDCLKNAVLKAIEK